MKKTLYERFVLTRVNFLSLGFFLIIFNIGFPFKSLLDVFLRRNIGIRGISIETNIILFLILFIPSSAYMYGFLFQDYNEFEGLAFFKGPIWVFSVLFLLMSIKRYKESNKELNTFDFEQFSMDAGRSLPMFQNAKRILGIRVTPLRKETIFEPGLAVLIGLIFMLIIQTRGLGLLLITSGIIYSLSYYSAYVLARHSTLDQIDELIIAGEMENVLLNDAPPEDAKGVSWPGQKPTSEANRKRLYNALFDDQPVHLVE